MDELAVLRGAMVLWTALAAVVFVVLLGRAAPYGRHAGAGGARTLPANRAWLFMELPTITLVPALYAAGRHRGELLPTLILALWLVHYLDRTLAYPRRIPAEARPVPLGIVVGAFAFQLVNGSLIGLWHFELAPAPGPFPRLRVAAGLLLFVLGFALNRWADGELARTRRESGGYGIPARGPFRRIACPNYLGEIVLWIGFALVAGSLAAAAFALWTVANPAPRARSHRRWYRERFGTAAPRWALVPGLW